jgi:deazaflavin-dependent oxidoreductase (nitroreductase family)
LKIPEPLFKLINLVVMSLLKSPFHRFWSDSLLIIHFVGRRSGKRYRTPVRYSVSGEMLNCFTSKSGKWWRNVKANGDLTVYLKGRSIPCCSTTYIDDPVRIRPALRTCLDQFPQDAAYHNIGLLKDGSLDESDFESALPDVVLIELSLNSH